MTLATVVGVLVLLAAPTPGSAASPTARAPAASSVPSRPRIAVPSQMPPGELGEVVALGKRLFEETRTHPLTRAYVGNALTCASCHPDAGASDQGSTLVGTAAGFPAWSPREEAVITLEDRVLNCFMRSLNGVRPPLGSKASVAITAYLTWLSTGTPIAMNPEAPFGPHGLERIRIDPAKVDLDAGRRTYEARCASCHGADGQGDPPVWGPRSYNAGSGAAQAHRLAAWLRVTMPPGDPSMTIDEAVNVAAYVDAQPRPDFVLRDHLPPGAAAGSYNATALDEVVRAPTWPPRK